MGSVALKFRVIPTDMEQYEAMGKDLAEKTKPYKMAEEEIGFGVKAIILTVVIGDEEGETEKLEETIQGCTNVDSFELLEMNRL